MNTFHWMWFDDSISLSGAGAGIVARLQDFYEAVDEYLGLYNANPVNVRIYNMADPEPRTPVYEDNLANLTYGSGAMPEEVAIACSFAGEPVSGLPQARRRGRIFLGPLTEGIQESGGTGVLVESAVVVAIADAAEALAASSAGGLAWAVYSRTNDDLVPITNGWVDNAFDTIRSRGVRRTQRQVWVLP